MNKQNFLISIVIATHNRSRYSIACVSSLLANESPLLQIVVHDTSDQDDELASWVAKTNNARLKYVRCPERLSMTENYERALAMAEGEYVAMIGDDDSASVLIVDLVSYAKESGIEILTPMTTASYQWPDFRTKLYGAAHAGKVYLDIFSGRIEEKLSALSLSEALAEACQGTGKLPKLYHGIVKKSLLDTIRERQGKVFFGTSPDISVSVSLCLNTHRYHTVDLPIVLPGSSGGSNAGRSAMRKHKGDIQTDPHMKPFGNLTWVDELPRFFSVETVWAHAAWETLRCTGNATRLDDFNLARLYALCLIRHFDYRYAIFAAFRAATKAPRRGVSAMAVSKELIATALENLIGKSRRLARPSPSNGREVLAVVEDVKLAREVLDRRLLVSPLCRRMFRLGE